MYESQSQSNNMIDPSLDPVNKNLVAALLESRPRAKTPEFSKLENELNDASLAEALWCYYGDKAMGTLDAPIQALNRDRKWWYVWKEQNTIRNLSKTNDGKRQVWRMIHEAVAWL